MLTILQRLNNWARRHPIIVAYELMFLSFLALIPAFQANMHGDVQVYRDCANNVISGKLPYRDTTFEYPPYAIPIFLLPRPFGDSRYLISFMILIVVGDIGVKLAMLRAQGRELDNPRSLLPLLLYSVAVPFLQQFYLQRYDVFPSLIALIGILLFCSKRYALSGFGVAVGIGMKLYPVIFVPPLLIIAWRDGKAKRFVSGIILGLLPIALLGFLLPWWKFAEFQNARGIHVESLYASVLWLAKQLNLADLHWANVKAKWSEVHGPLAITLLPWVRGLFLAAVGTSTLVAMRASGACGIPPTVARLSRLLLLPLLAFIVFNQVFSPQFMIWLLPLAALAILEGKVLPILSIFVAAGLTPAFVPPTSDWSLVQTGVLILRNLILVAAWVFLAWEFVAPRREHRIDNGTARV